MRRRLTRTILWTCISILVAGLLAPLLVTFSFWHGRISSALARAVGRGVRIGSVHPKLFGGPGFEIDQVVLEEDPRFGVEPFARIETVRATLGLGSIWNRQLQFSSLVLERPRINLVRNLSGEMAGRWNLESLGKTLPREPSLGGAAPQKPAGSSPFRPMPKIQIDGGRIDFKTGDRKEVYLIDDLDADIVPSASDAQPWRLSFEGTPKRTDFGFGSGSRFRGQAAFGPFSPAIQSETGTLAHLDLDGENVFVEDILRFFTGSDQGMHGSLNLNLHLAGTTSLLRISGTADLRDLHRWDRLPPMADKVLHAEIAAILDMERDSFELRSTSIPMEKGSVVVQGVVEHIFHHPVPTLDALLHDAPLDEVVAIAKQFTPRLDPRLTAQGSLNGAIHMEGSPQSLQGALTVAGARFEIKDAQLVARPSNFDLVFDGSTGRTEPITVSLGEGGRLSSTLAWDTSKRDIKARLESDDLDLKQFLAWAKALGSPWGRANFTEGDLALRVTLSSTAGLHSVSGTAQIVGGQLESTALNQPVRIATARILLQPGKITVKPFSATMGKLQWGGTMVVNLAPTAEADTPASFPAVEFDWHASHIDIEELDRLMNPRNRAQSFFNFDARPAPAANFFPRVEARGAMDAPSLSYHGKTIQNFKAMLSFRNRTLDVKNFSGQFAGGGQTGSAMVKFAPGQPEFNIESHFTNLNLEDLTGNSSSWSGFFSGNISGDLCMSGSGSNLGEIAEHLSGTGIASGTDLELRGMDLAHSENKASPVTRIGYLSSKFQIANKEVRIQELRIAAAPPSSRRARAELKPALTVSGTVGFDRSLDLMVGYASERSKTAGKELHWGGTLAMPMSGVNAASLRPRYGR